MPPSIRCSGFSTVGRPTVSPMRLGVKVDGGMPFKTPFIAVLSVMVSIGDIAIFHFKDSNHQFGITKIIAIAKILRIYA